jgi:aminoglycoside phosphotransferase (APT) family kinase protein
MGPGPLRPRVVCHGDFHLGQLVRHPAPDGSWLLIDIDDLGLGDPAWDLARPAAWFACGLVPAGEWGRLLGAYQATTGTAGSDPWSALDLPARAITVQLAALSVARACGGGDGLDEDDAALLDACARMSRSVRSR